MVVSKFVQKHDLRFGIMVMCRYLHAAGMRQYRNGTFSTVFVQRAYGN